MSTPAASFILTIRCPAAMGVVAQVSAFLCDAQLYILSMAQFDDEQTGNFFCRIHFRHDQGDELDISHLRASFENMAIARKMQWDIIDADRPQQVMIMVSKADHCLQDLLYRKRKGQLNMVIPAVVSNHQTLRKMVEREGITFTHLPVDKNNKIAQEAKMLAIVEEMKIDLVVLARYMQVLSNDACKALTGRCINIHHSFLPGFKGARPYHRAFDRGVKMIGATAHYVTADLDEGPIIEQAVEPVDHHFDVKALITTGRDIESRALARAVRYHIEQRVFIDQHKTVIFK